MWEKNIILGTEELREIEIPVGNLLGRGKGKAIPVTGREGP
jgi:hypothetical protein